MFVDDDYTNNKCKIIKILTEIKSPAIIVDADYNSIVLL